ncbi:MAG: hypothetical protein WD851_04575 [Pirellulales bacterium]
MEPARCAELIQQIAAAGYGGAYLHARLGMLIPYMSEAYVEAIAASVTAASDCGIHAHLYDEDRWPSGWAGGAVPRTDASFRVKALVQRRKEMVDDSYRLIAIAGGLHYYVATMPLGHPKFNGACYTDLTNPEAIRCFLQRAYEPLQTRLGDSFGRATPTIFTDEPALTYLYTWPEGGLHWSDRLPPRFFDATGIELTEVLGALFNDQPDSAPVRIHFYRILAELFTESFMRQISDWCRQHGIRWTGHFMYEHSLPLHFSWSANGHSSYRYFDWPGVDHLGRQVGEVVTALGCRSSVHQFAKERMMTELYGASGQHLSFADRKWIGEQQIVLGANHLVPHLMSTTIRGARKRDYPPTLSPHQPWWPLNHVVEDHVARLCELLSRGHAQTDLLIIHPQESAYALSRGPVAVGDADTWTGRFFHPADDARLESMDQLWKRLCHRLLDAGYMFDFGDEAVLADCGSVDKQLVDEQRVEPRLRVGAATYRAVIVPPQVTIRLSTVRLLTAFAEAGGIVAQLGDRPQLVDGSAAAQVIAALDALSQKVAIHAASQDELVERLLETSPPEIQIDSSPGGQKVWRYTKSADICQTTLLVNLDRLHERSVRVKWRHSRSRTLTVWHTHLADSHRMAADAGRLLFTLPPSGSCVVIEGERPRLVPPSADIHPPADTVDAAALAWQVTRLDENALVIDRAEFCLGDGMWRGPYPVLAIKEWLDCRRYSGPLSLRFAFSMNLQNWSPTPLKLIVENIERPDVHVRVNGHAFDATNITRQFWCDPHWHPCSITPKDLQSSNCIEVALEQYQFADPGASAPERRLGTELESIIVLGDFAVEGTPTSGPQGWRGQIEFHTGTPLADWLPTQKMRYLASPLAVHPPRKLTTGDVVCQGLPFYAGRLRYDAEIFRSNSPDAAVLFRLDALMAPVAALDVNGKQAGCLAWAPYEVDIGPLLTPGTNHISLTLYHSLRNLQGPHHHPHGEPVYVTPGSFRPERCTNWLETLLAGQSAPDWADSYSFVEFGLFAGAFDAEFSA